MQHISKSFCYKSYRNTLAEDLIETRLKSKVKANNSLNIEKETIKYQVAKLIKKSVFHFRKFIDFDVDVASNKITEHNVIICKRVSKNAQDNTTTLI